jgi:fatty-acyl-CoA synthase
VLHAYGEALPDVFDLSIKECVLPVVPMFHVNAWGTPYAVPMVGAKLVLPGPKMGDGQALHELMEREEVTLSLGVPTVWLGLLAYLDEAGKTLGSLKRVVIGGAACPASVVEKFRDVHKVYVHQAWGMTEMTPLGTFNTLKPGMADLPQDQLLAIQTKQGRGVYGVEMKITDDDNHDLPWDGEAFGSLKVRGPWVCSGYFGGEEARIDADGWFDTGDVATIDPEGFMLITDRTKDVIKSGGEWISSVDLENAAVAHPAIAMAACIGATHPKWDERPILMITIAEGAEVPSQDDVVALLAESFAKWQLPDAVIVVDAIPMTATGKIDKKPLRAEYQDYLVR